MNDDKSFNARTARHHAGAALAFAVLAAVPACGNLDETDADPPSVDALALWQSSQLVAVRTYHKEPVIVDLQSGTPTGKLPSGKSYNDVEPLGNGDFIALHNQSIDFVDAGGRIDESRSIAGYVLTHMAVSADRATLAYAELIDPTTNKIGIVDLPSGNVRFSPPGVTFNNGDSLSVSRDGNLVAFALGDVGVARTHAPDPAAPDVPAVSTCVLAFYPPLYGGPVATACSPVEDKLAVSQVDGGLNIFDLGHYPDCRLLSNLPSQSPSPDNQPRIWHLQYSPSGSVLAISVETEEPSQTAGVTVMTGVVRLLDAGTGAALRDLSVYQWETTPGPRSGGPLITDLQWSEAGDRISVSITDGPVQQWDVATGNLLWSAKL